MSADEQVSPEITARTIVATDKQWFDVLVEFFMNNYRATDLIEQLNTGVMIHPNELRDFGRLAQARGNAIQIIDKMREVVQ